MIIVCLACVHFRLRLSHILKFDAASRAMLCIFCYPLPRMRTLPHACFIFVCLIVTVADVNAAPSLSEEPIADDAEASALLMALSNSGAPPVETPMVDVEDDNTIVNGAQDDQARPKPNKSRRRRKDIPPRCSSGVVTFTQGNTVVLRELPVALPEPLGKRCHQFI